MPQETVLFNEDVTYNIRYGSMRDGEPTGGDKEIIESSIASQLHEKVMTGPQLCKMLDIRHRPWRNKAWKPTFEHATVAAFE